MANNVYEQMVISGGAVLQGNSYGIVKNNTGNLSTVPLVQS